MRFVQRLLIALVGLIFVLIAVSYLLPREVYVSRAIVIDAPAEEIYPYVSSLQAMSEWSPWLGRDPEMHISYTGKNGTVGSAMTWSSEHPQVGSGTQEITEIVPNEKVVTSLDFGQRGEATAAFHLMEVDDATTVTWDMQTDMGSNPIGRWMGLMMDRWVGNDYERGLDKLKMLVGG